MPSGDSIPTSTGGLFELAPEKVPSYALTREGLDWVWAMRQQMRLTPAREAGPKARAEVLRAIALDENSAGAPGALAMALGWTDWNRVVAHAERAVELDGNSP